MLTSGGPWRGRNTRPSTPKLNNSFTAITIDYSDQNKRGSRRSTLLGRFILFYGFPFSDQSGLPNVCPEQTMGQLI